MNLDALARTVKEQARQHGFVLAGITTPHPPPHFNSFQAWLDSGHHANMAYLADDRSRARRADPCLILPECRSILVLGMPYSNPQSVPPLNKPDTPRGRVAAYAWGDDYHLIIPHKLQALVNFLEEQLGQPIPNRYYTDTGPLLERDLAQRAGLGWIGKNTCLIAPQQGSYFFLAEILLGLELPPDPPFTLDHCGNCTRCIESCPTGCILPNRTIDARRCISYLTIENKDEIPPELRPLLQNWVFGCDICQMACPWNNRFAPPARNPAFAPRPGIPNPVLAEDLALSAAEFNQKFKDSPVKRAKHRGYLRNIQAVIHN